MYTVASPDPNPGGGGQLPNPNECNSTLTSGTNNIYPCPYIDVNDRGHRLRITHTPRRRQATKISFRRICIQPTAISFLIKYLKSSLTKDINDNKPFRPQIKSLNH